MAESSRRVKISGFVVGDVRQLDDEWANSNSTRSSSPWKAMRYAIWCVGARGATLEIPANSINGVGTS
jgi:hypothetical protein